MKKMKNVRLAVQLAAGTLLVVMGIQNMPMVMALILAATAVAGSFYCGWICPFGTIQDLMSRVFKNKKYKMPKVIQKYLAFSRYILLVLTLALSADFIFTIMKYDARINFLSIIEGKSLSIMTYVVIATYLMIAIFFERPFCNYLCPEGAKYGAISMLRPFRIIRNENLCVNCKKCDKVCPMNIEVSTSTFNKSSQCINCLNCVSECPKKGALKFGVIPLKGKKLVAYLSLVLFVVGVASGVVAYSFISDVKAQQEVQVNVDETSVVNESKMSSNVPSGTNESEVSSSETSGTNKNDVSSSETSGTNESVVSSNVSKQAENVTTTADAGVSKVESTNTETVAETTVAPAVAETKTTETVKTVTSALPKGAAAGIADGTYTGDGNGFRGTMTVAVTVQSEQIVRVEVVSNSDDRKWFERALSVIPDAIVQAQSTDVDTVSGATYSSIGIIEGAKNALQNAK